MITAFVGCPDGSSYRVPIKANDTVADFKKNAAEQSGCSPEDFDLMHEGNELSDETAVVVDSGVMDGAEFEMVLTRKRAALNALGRKATSEHMINDIRNGGSNVRLYLEAGIEPVNTTAIQAACECCQIDVVKDMVEYYTTTTTTERDKLLNDLGLGLIAASTKEGGSEMVSVLVSEFGADVNHRAAFTDQTPLHFACKLGNLSVVKTLLSLKADINQLSAATNSTPFAAACLANQTDVVEYLLQKGAASSPRCFETYSPLTLVCQRGRASLVQTLLPFCDVNAFDIGGRTPLTTASGYGRKEVVELLLENNVNVNTADRKGCSPLFSSVLWNCFTVAELLLQHGADVDQMANGTTPLHHACLKGNVALVELLLKYKADVHRITKRGDNALHAASTWGNPELMKLLLDSGCDHKAANGVGKIPLHILCERDMSEGSIECLQMLLSCDHSDVLVNARDLHGSTPLAAASMRSDSAVRLLLEAGADPNIKSVDGRTALFLASAIGTTTTLRLLIEHGADPTLRDRSNKSPFSVASSEEKLGILRAAKKRSSPSE